MYDFDKIIERRGTNSYKWDACPSKEDLPLWVADMDFAVAPASRRRCAAAWNTLYMDMYACPIPIMRV